METESKVERRSRSLHRAGRAVRLFLAIVWRRWEDPRPGWPTGYACTYRLSVTDAWRIAWNVHRPTPA